MVDFSDRLRLETWLRNQPRSIVVGLAARAAGRVIPTLNRDMQRFTIMTLATFRAIALARVVATYPTRARDLAASATYAADAASAAVNDATAAYAARAAVNAATAAYAASAAAYAATAAYAASSAAPYAARAAVNAATAADAADAADANVGRLATTVKLWPLTEAVQRPLPGFERSLPAVFEELWRGMKFELLVNKDEHWRVWTDWYDAWLAGAQWLPQFSARAREELEVAICLIPNAAWKQGPAHVNGLIQGMIDAALSEADIPEDSLPKQTPNAAIFGANEQGQIARAPPTESDRLSESSEVSFFYGEARELCRELHGLGAQFLGDATFKCADRMSCAFPAVMSDAMEREVWAAGNALRRKLSAHDAVEKSPDYHPDRLEAGAVERLRGFVDAFNQLAFADPKLRARDERRPGPQETRDSRKEVALIAPISELAAANEEATTREVAADLRFATSEAKASGEAVVDRLAVEQARDTHRNFQASLLISAYRSVLRVKKAAQGEGGFITKEIAGGAYKAIGAGVVSTLGFGAYSMATGQMNSPLSWDAIQIVVSNLSTLRPYALLAFEDSPAVKALLDWLEVNVEIEERERLGR